MLNSKNTLRTLLDIMKSFVNTLFAIAFVATLFFESDTMLRLSVLWCYIVIYIILRHYKI